MRTPSKSSFVGVAISFLLLIQIPNAHAAPVDGVSISTNGLLFFYDSANYYGVNGTTVKDLSGNSRDGSLNQISSQPSVSTANGGHFSFNANGGYMTAPSISSITNSFSLSFYASFGSTANNFERIIDFGNGPTNNNLEVGREGTGTNLFVEMFNGASSPGYCRAIGAIDSAWHHWVVTVGGGKCNIYKDNLQIVTDSSYSGTVGSTTWSNMYIGKSNWSADAAFEGGIAELAFYNRALLGSEVAQNYNAAMDQTAPTYTGAATFYPNENQTLVGTLSTSESSYIIPLTGSMDTNKFTLAANVLSFLSAPNFELKASSGGSNNYSYYFQLMDLNGNVATSTYVPVIQVQDLIELATLTQPSLSGNPVKGTNLTITVTPYGDGTSLPGKVSYFMAGKRIAGCYKKSYSGTGNSTCSWKPTTMGFRELSVQFTPTNTNFTETTSKKSFLILKRTTNR